MNKKTQMWLGVAAVAAVGYYLWNKSQEKKSFAMATGTPKFGPIVPTPSGLGRLGERLTFRSADGCPSGWSREKNRNGVMVCKSPDGTKQYRTN